jgi:hypothetical protein
MPPSEYLSPRAAVEGDFLDDALVHEERVADAEHRHKLEAKGRIAAEVEIDLSENGPLGRYVIARRHQALAALHVLATGDVRDAVAMAEAQGEVREYLRARLYIRTVMEEADQARSVIKEEYGSGNDDHSYRD